MAQDNNPSPIIAPGSTVLVTGANGLIASHACDQLLAAGYRVRATVRSALRNAWMTDLFTEKYGPDSFELVEVPDITIPEAWDLCVDGVSAIAHAASAIAFDVGDIDKTLDKEMRIHFALLNAARKETSIKSVVMISSAWATCSPSSDKVSTLTEQSWNDEAVQLVRDQSIPAEKLNFFTPIMALKTLMEKDVWSHLKSNPPNFTFNTLLIGTVMGRSVDPKNQGLTSTAAMVCWPWEGQGIDMLNAMPPQWHVDVEDVGRLFVAALILPGVDKERLFAYGERYSWTKVTQILKKLEPEKPIADGIKDLGWDQTEVPNGRAEELLRKLGRKNFINLEESVKSTAKSWIEARE